MNARAPSRPSERDPKLVTTPVMSTDTTSGTTVIRMAFTHSVPNGSMMDTTRSTVGLAVAAAMLPRMNPAASAARTYVAERMYYVILSDAKDPLPPDRGRCREGEDSSLRRLRSSGQAAALGMTIPGPSGLRVCEAVERIAREAVDRPFVHRNSAETLVESNRGLVPIQHPPLHPATPTRDRKAREIRHEPASDAASPVLGPHEDILEIQPTTSEERRVVVKEQREPGYLGADVRHH